jgi:hypothetical protein
MGAGNPKLSSFDSDKFEPTTYFLDLSEDEEEVIKNLTEENGEEPDDDLVSRERAFLEEMHFEDLIESICSELNHTSWNLQSRDNCFGELTYAFRESGLIMTEGKRCYVITETSGDYYHLPIGIIPNFKFETFLEDAEFEMRDKQDWYSARGKSISEAIDKLAERNWEKEMKEFYKEAETVLQAIHSWYGEKMSGRNGAWMSGPVDPTRLAA